MPLCKFLCSCCGHEFELFLRPSEIGAEVKCPHCQAEIKEGGPVEQDGGQSDSGGYGPGKVT